MSGAEFDNCWLVSVSIIQALPQETASKMQCISRNYKNKFRFLQYCKRRNLPIAIEAKVSRKADGNRQSEDFSNFYVGELNALFACGYFYELSQKKVIGNVIYLLLEVSIVINSSSVLTH